MLTVERYSAALLWIEGTTTATPAGLTEGELGRLLALIANRAASELSAPNVGAKRA